MDQTSLPVEIAVSRCAELVGLLIALGAEVNSCIQETKRNYIQEDQKKTVVDWVTFAVQNLDEKIEKERKEGTEVERVDLSNQPTGKSMPPWLAKCARNLRGSRNAKYWRRRYG